MLLKKIYVDIESYFDTESGYDLKSMSMTEYIRDKRFRLLGCGYRYEGEYGWVRANDMAEFISLDWSNFQMIAHNVKFDGAVLKWLYGIVPGQYFDTQSLARAVLGQNLSSYSLKAVSAYLGLPPKGELKSDGLMVLSPSQEQEMMVYNARDLEDCEGIDKKLRPLFPEGQIWSMDWTIRAFTDPRLIIDVPLLEKFVASVSQNKQDVFKKLGIPEEVFSSNKQFAELLEARKIEVPKKISPTTLKRGGPQKYIPALSLTDEGFIALQKTCPDLYEARVAAKSTIDETRGNNLIKVGRTGPFPFDVNYSGAIGTHRGSGGSGAGGNPQNFPNEGDIRKSITVSPGERMVVGDFSSIEAREVGWLAKDPKIIAAYLSNADLYCDFASDIYGFRVTKKEHPLQRKVGKTSILGLGYQMWANKFQARLKLPEPYGANIEIDFEEAKRIVLLYRSTFANVPLLWESAEALIPQMAEGYTNYVPFAPFLRIEKSKMVLPSGLEIQYPGLRRGVYYNSNLKREQEGWIYDVYGNKRYETEIESLYGGKLVENICQAICGEIKKIAIQEIESVGIRCVGEVHDEIISIVPEADEQAAVKTVKEIMERTINWWPEIRLGAEVHSGTNWAAAKGA